MMKNQNKYQSILVIVTGFLIMSFVFRGDYDWGFMIFKRIYFIYAAVWVGILSLVFESVADLLLKGWMKLAEVLGFINTRILLSAIFFIFLTPFAWLQKLFSKKDHLQLKNAETSHYEKRDHEYQAADLENVW